MPVAANTHEWRARNHGLAAFFHTFRTLTMDHSGASLAEENAIWLTMAHEIGAHRETLRLLSDGCQNTRYIISHVRTL